MQHLGVRALVGLTVSACLGGGGLAVTTAATTAGPAAPRLGVVADPVPHAVAVRPTTPRPAPAAYVAPAKTVARQRPAAVTTHRAAPVVRRTAPAAAPAVTVVAGRSFGLLPRPGTLTPREGLRRALRAHLVSSTGQTLPASVDLSAWTVPVGDQGSVNSCVTWAIDYAMLGWYSRRQGHAGTPYAPMYAYSQIQALHGWNDQGAYAGDGYQIAEQQGIDTLADYPQGNYDWQTLPTAAQKQNAAQHKTVGSSFLYSTYPNPPGPSSQTAIETALAGGHPVALSIPVYSAFLRLSATSAKLDAADIDPSTYLGGHEVLAIGYDDYGVRIQNSWGTSWGDHGFAQLGWAFLAQYGIDASMMSGFAAASSAPAVSSLDPAGGPVPGGTTVTVHGVGLTGATGVSFGATPAVSFSVVDDGTLTAVSPAASATGPAAVTVTGPSGTSAAGAAFTYTGPTLTSINPAIGPVTGGTPVVLTGSGLTGATAVSFGSAPAASWTAVSDTTLTAVSPPGLAGVVPVTVTIGSVPAAPTSFRYAAGPRVAALSPSSGRATGGNVVSVRGSGLTGVTAVTFGTRAARIVARVSDGELRVVVPRGTGKVVVRVTTAYGVSSSRYTYLPAPRLGRLGATSGSRHGGSRVTITGSGFLRGAVVWFGGSRASRVQVLDSRHIIVVTPAHPRGTVAVQVATHGGRVARARAYQFR